MVAQRSARGMGTDVREARGVRRRLNSDVSNGARLFRSSFKTTQTRRLRWLFNVFPAYRGTGARVRWGSARRSG